MPKVVDNEKLRKDAEELFQKGIGITEIARQLKSNKPMIYKVLDKDFHKKEADKLKEKILRYHKMGLNMPEIAKLCDISKQYVFKVLNSK